MSFLTSLMSLDASATLPAEQCSALLRQLEQQSMAGLDDPEKPMRIQGQDALVHRLMMAVVLNEHVLLEGLPGVAKTSSVEFVAQDTGLTCRRVQFVPDMQPSDLIGKDQINLSALSNHQDQDIRHWENGPIFNNIVIADEINRAPSKVQAALLESMAERGITPFAKQKFVIRSDAEWRMWLRWIFSQAVYRNEEVWGVFWPEIKDASRQPLGELAVRLERALAEQHWHLFGPLFPWADRIEAGENTLGASPIDLRNTKDAQFTVFATMNPIELEGTFPLSEAQNDRFCFKTLVKYPSYNALKAVTRMINPPRQAEDPDRALLRKQAGADEALRRSLYFFRRCREVMFGKPGEQGGSLLDRTCSDNGAEASTGLDVITRLVFFSHLRQPEEGSRKAQQMAHLLKDPEQIERHARLMREDLEHAALLKDEIWQYIQSGASPRAQMFLTKAALCEQLLAGGEHMDMDCIRQVAHDILRHRIRVNVQARVRGIQPEDVVDVLLQQLASSKDGSRT